MTGPLEWPLKEGEALIWQGRPAPRCYVFRYWLQALLGTLIFLASSFWLMVGYHLVSVERYSPWLLAIPVLLVCISLIIGPGHIIWKRIQWEHVFYAVSEQRLFVRCGTGPGRVKIFPLGDLKGYRRKRYGKNQVSFRLTFCEQQPVVLECLEHSENFSRCLPQIDDPGTGESV